MLKIYNIMYWDAHTEMSVTSELMNTSIPHIFTHVPLAKDEYVAQGSYHSHCVYFILLS